MKIRRRIYIERDGSSMLSFSMNMVTMVIGFGMSSTFILFVCIRLICSRIRSTGSRAAAFDVELHSDVRTPERSINSLGPAVVAAIPTIQYNKETFHSCEGAQCTICLGEYQEGEILRIMPTCGHNFHLSCIDVWLQRQSTCPICRLSLNDLIEAKCATFHVVNRHEVSNHHANQWLSPSHQISEGRRSNEDSHESLSVMMGSAHTEELETGR